MPRQTDKQREEAVQEEKIPGGGVFVQTEVDDEGVRIASVNTVGDTRATEVETVLKLALKKWRETSGLDF